MCPADGRERRDGCYIATTPRTVVLLLLVPARSGALLSSIFDGREQVFQEIGALLCGLFSFIVMFLGSRLQAAREDLDAPGRTIIVDPGPLEVRVESAALVLTMERLPVCPNADVLPHE